MSRATGLWSAIKVVADLADATASVDLHPERIRPIMPLVKGERYQHTPYGQLLTPLTLDIEREIVEVRYELARQYATDNRLNEIVVDPSNAWVGIVSSGITYREVREALHRLGLSDEASIAGAGIRLLKMGMPMPFNQALVRSFARGLDELIVVEEKQPNVESLIKDALYATADRPLIVGKTDEQDRLMFASWGALDADEILPILRRRLAPRLEERLAPLPRQRTLLPLAVQRTPFYCSGCPHNRSTEVPDGALVGAGIGCHTMTLLMDPSRVGEIVGITCMGNEGTQWIGMSDFVDTPHLFQNLGDGTFFHSGQLAIQAAVAAGVNITYKLLYNGTVAMTGGQDPVGQMSVARVAAMLLTQGVAKVLITTDTESRYRTRAGGLPAGVEVWDRSRLIEAQELLARMPGVTVLIHDQACAAEARRDRKLGTVETPNRTRRHQPAYLRRVRRLWPGEQLPVGTADRNAVWTQDPHRSDHLQSRLQLPRRRLPELHDRSPAEFFTARSHGSPKQARSHRTETQRHGTGWCRGAFGGSRVASTPAPVARSQHSSCRATRSTCASPGSAEPES